MYNLNFYFFCDPFKFNVESFGLVTKTCVSFIKIPLISPVYFF